MIPKKYSGADLIGRRCRPTRNITNGAGEGITPDTVCYIRDVVRGHGFSIKTEICPHCGQFARISRISREDLELIDDDAPISEATIPADKLQSGAVVVVIERGPDNMPNGVSEYIFLAKTDDYVIVSETMSNMKSLNEILRYHAQHTSGFSEACLNVYPAKDCYLTAADAWNAIRATH